MIRYIYAECPVDYWPSIKSITAVSLEDATEKLIEKYTNEFEDDEIGKISEFKYLRDYLNDQYSLAISDLYDYEEI